MRALGIIGLIAFIGCGSDGGSSDPCAAVCSCVMAHAGSSSEQDCATQCSEAKAANNPIQDCQDRLAANGLSVCDSNCGGLAPSAMSAGNASSAPFVGTWRQTHGSFHGTCLSGPIETNGNGVTIQFTASSATSLKIESGANCGGSAVVSGNTANASNSQSCALPNGATDPVTLKPVTTPTTVTFTTDQYQYDVSSDTLTETLSIAHDSSGQTCTFTGTATYSRN